MIKLETKYIVLNTTTLEFEEAVDEDEASSIIIDDLKEGIELEDLQVFKTEELEVEFKSGNVILTARLPNRGSGGETREMDEVQEALWEQGCGG